MTAGNSIIHFEKDAGSDRFRGNLVQASAVPECSILTSNYNDDIQRDFIVRHNGANWTACRFFQNSDFSNYTYFARSDEGIFQFDFMRTTYIDKVFINNGWGGNSPEYLYIEGSTDGNSWHVLYSQHNEPFGEHKLQKHGYFRHYRLRFNPKGVSINRIDVYGFYINDEAYELENLMPIMSSDEENGYKITSTELYEGVLCNLTKSSADSGVCLNAQKAGGAWIQYELPEPKVMDLLDIGALKNGSMVQWYKFEASNDGENWTLLLEKREKNGFYICETRQFWFENNLAYKYYRLTAMDATPSRWSIGRMRLYKKVDGIAPTEGFIPALSAATQYGYKITASSDSGSGHYPYYAFDKDMNTKWATAQNDHIGGWLCVEFPTNTLCNRVWMRSRNDGWYYQAPVSFTIQGSMDGVSFETLKTVSDITWTQGEEKVFEFFNEQAFLFYRIQANAVQSENYFGLSELNFGVVERSFKRDLFELRCLTPNMTANSQDGFILTASSILQRSDIFTFPKASRVGDRVEILSISNEKMPINIVANPEAEKPLELIYPDNVYSGEQGGTIAVVQITDVNVLFIY